MRTSTSRWLFWLALARLAVCCLAAGEFFVLSGPNQPKGDFWHANQLAREMYCLTDDLGSALVWNSNLRWTNDAFKALNQVKKPYIVLGDRNVVYPASDNLTCQMDSKSSCSHYWSLTGDWAFVNSLTRPMAPVADNRWELFEEKLMLDRFDFVSSELPVTGSLAFSIRGLKDAHLALCNQANPESSFCYYVILGGWNNTKSVIRQCKNGVPEPSTNYPQGDCSVARAEHQGSVLSDSEWRSFVLKWDFQGKTEISVYDTNEKLLSFLSTDISFPQKHQFLFARSTEQMFVKFHTYGYSVTTSTQSKLISPRTMAASSEGNICVELSISLCENCQMTLDFVDSHNVTFPGRVFKGEVVGSPYDLPAWHNVKVNKTRRMQQPIRMVVNTLFTNSTSDNPFWAVANIRRCYDGDFKAVRILAFQDDSDGYFWPNVTCQKISNQGSSIIESTHRNLTSSRLDLRTLCTEGRIGKSCSVSCSKLFPDSKDCKSLQACDQTGCSCAPGFTKSSSCTKHCTDSTYGYECQRKCGNCTDGSCSFATGDCKLGCESDKDNVYLPPFCKIGVSSLPPPHVDTINSTSVRLYTDMKREYYLIPTNVTFEIWENSSVAAFVSNVISIQRTTSVIEIFAERLKPGTHYKSVGVINARNKTLRGEWGNFTTPCTESTPLSFPVTSDETNVTVDNVVDRHVNDSCPYTWYQIQFFNGKQRLFADSTTFPKNFTNLEPYTDYRVVVKSHKTPLIVTKVVKTLEGAPEEVQSLAIVRSTHDSITITWQPPEVPRGVVTNYTARIQLAEPLGCRDQNTMTNDKEPFVLSSVLANTSQSIYLHKFGGLKPYSRYDIQVHASTSRHHGQKANLSHSTSSLEVPTETFTNLRLSEEASGSAKLRWDPPSDCSEISGPIRAAKLFIGKPGDTPMTKKTENYFFDLEKSYFNGLETYEVRLHVLRGMGDVENQTAFANLSFTMPSREPPPVRNFEIIEVDPVGKTVTFRWSPPESPIHGILERFDIRFCDEALEHCQKDTRFIATIVDLCGPWDLTGIWCKTLSLPDDNLVNVQIRAYNHNDSLGSEPVTLPLSRADSQPSAPFNLSLTPVRDGSSEIQVSWHHPLLSNGRIKKFEVEATILTSDLKTKPWTSQTLYLDVPEYQPTYNLAFELFPSTTFTVNIRAVTTTDLPGNPVRGEVDIPDRMEFGSKNLRPRVSEDQGIAIEVPEVVNEIEGSSVLVLVQGNCGKNQSSGNFGLDVLNSTYYDKVWKAAEIADPGVYARKTLTIGGLCHKDSYIVYVLLVNNRSGVLGSQNPPVNLGDYVVEIVQTQEIQLGEVSVHLATWLVPLLVLVLLAVLLIFVAYRKRFLESKYRKGKGNGLNNNHEIVPLNKDPSNVIVEKLQLATLKPSTESKEQGAKVFEMPVKVDDFEEYLWDSFRLGRLDHEFETLQSGFTQPHDYGSQTELKPKNRYQNTVPYDSNRVVLEKQEDEPGSDYINASYIRGFDGRNKAYIASQGPRSNTVNDFWRMCWENNVRVICMMTNLQENGREKCEQYWPSTKGQKVLFDKVWVEFASEEVHTDYTYRTFVVSRKDEEPREVRQLHYTAWPDHGVPKNTRAMISFLREMHKHAPIPRGEDEPPILIHCSAGVGRTGTLIVLDMAICLVTLQQAVDVNKLVVSVRKDRVNMVQTDDQYLFVHLVILEYLNSEHTCFPCDKMLPSKIAVAKANEEKTQFNYQRVLKTQWMDCVLGPNRMAPRPLSEKNKAKHRFPVATESPQRLYLKRSVLNDEDSDYIAATRVEGLFNDGHYVATQLPLPTTLGDFWRMVAELDVQLVLVLQPPDPTVQTYCELVPESQGFASTNYLKVVRQQGASIVSQYYFKEEVLLLDSSQFEKVQIVKIVNFNRWPKTGDSLPAAEEMVDLWRSVRGFKGNKKDAPVVVVCRDGVKASGLWLTVTHLLNRMSDDGECDVPQAVRETRRCRKDFFDVPEYFCYLYDVALKWYEASQHEDEV